MIPKILSTSRNAEVCSVSTNISTAFHKTSLSSDTLLLEIITGMDEKNTILSGALKRLKEKSQLLNLDVVRDNSTRAVWYLVLGLTFHPDEAINSAAKKVFTIFENFGLQIVNEAYAVESAHIGTMLGQLAAPDVQAAIGVLSGCAVLIDRLATAETNFEISRVEFESIKGNEGTFASASKLKRELASLINEKLSVYLDGKLIGNNIAHNDFARTIAQIIDDNNRIVKKRMSKKPEVPAS